MSIKKIVIIGPESTGKSTLSQQLAAHYNTEWVPEYARTYLLKHGNQYTYEDLLKIAQGQLASEDAALQSLKMLTGEQTKYLFIDTDMYVMKVWCEFVFGKCHPWILQQIVLRKYDYYLLCNTDLEWTADELREYPDKETRQKLFLMYKDLLVNQHTPWTVISGNDEKRLEGAINIIESQLRATHEL